MGIIRSTDKSMTNIQYKVDDMTGAPMDVKQWVDTEVSQGSFTLFSTQFKNDVLNWVCVVPNSIHSECSIMEMCEKCNFCM